MNSIWMYNYKIQWIFPVRGSASTEARNKRELFSVIKILGAKSLTEIVFRDVDGIPIGSYSGMVSFDHTVADKRTVEYLRSYLKKNPEVLFVELLRK